ncbi:MAG: radical SAM protein [Promethearchaeota archaeon]|nr:MAG: radical SAM protein [Candidatus Lokiarchaeota archaeon]
MDIRKQIWQKFEENDSGQPLLKWIVNLQEERLPELLAEAWRIRQENFAPILHCFYPGEKFPAISITGTSCALNCKHCTKHYLSLMNHAETPMKLWKLCEKYAKEGKVGVLLSGGFNEQAMLPFSKFLPIIKKIKQETELILNVHTGLINAELARQLGDAGVDMVSFDIVGDKDTIEEIYQLKKSPTDYIDSLKFLHEGGIPHIVPHICIGLREGNLSGEFYALKLIRNFAPALIVLLGLIPTRSTPLQNITPNVQNIAKFIATTRILFPETPISMGCMRPGKEVRPLIDRYAIESGVNRIEIPTRKAIEYAVDKGLEIRKYEACCAVPLELL